MDEKMDELGGSLEDLEIGIEFVSYTGPFQENLKAWESEILLVARLVIAH